MGNRITIEHCHQKAKERGGNCLSEIYVNAHTKMTWVCEKGHEWDTVFGSILRGSWCKKCKSDKQRKTIKDCVELAKQKNGECLSENYVDAHTSLTWKCKHGHVWEVNYNQIQQGYWCPYCAGNARKTIDDARNLAFLKNGFCLSEKINNAREKLLWKCSKGHVWKTDYNQIQQGGWCPECSGKKKKTIDDCRKLAELNGGSCLSEKYDPKTGIVEWKCSFGHAWKSSYHSVSSGTWCPECAGVKKKTIDDCFKMASLKNGFCLSEKIDNIKEKLTWKCERGHIWETNYNTIQRGRWCPECAIQNRIKHTIDECREIARNKNGFCLSEKYISSSSVYLWMCEKGHKWSATFNSVQQGGWCKICGMEKLKNTLQDCRDLAKKYNGNCLSEEYKNNYTPIFWECEKGHQWKAIYNSIKQGSWCPMCSGWKTQKELYQIIKNIYSKFTHYFNFRDFDWLKDNKYSGQELDIFVKDVRSDFSLAIEYDGEQHFRTISYFGGEENFKKIIYLDQLKEQKIKEHPEDIKYFIRFNYKEKITEEYVRQKLKLNNIPIFDNEQ